MEPLTTTHKGQRVLAYYVPETDRLPACDTCARYTPDGAREGGVGTCPLNGQVTAGGYCALHKETRSRKVLERLGYRRGA